LRLTTSPGWHNARRSGPLDRHLKSGDTEGLVLMLRRQGLAHSGGLCSVACGGPSKGADISRIIFLSEGTALSLEDSVLTVRVRQFIRRIPRYASCS